MSYTFNDLMEETELVGGNDLVLIDIGGRYADIVEIRIEGNQIILVAKD